MHIVPPERKPLACCSSEQFSFCSFSGVLLWYTTKWVTHIKHVLQHILLSNDISHKKTRKELGFYIQVALEFLFTPTAIFLFLTIQQSNPLVSQTLQPTSHFLKEHFSSISLFSHSLAQGISLLLHCKMKLLLGCQCPILWHNPICEHLFFVTVLI